MALFGTKTEEKKQDASPAVASSVSVVSAPTVFLLPRISEKASKLAQLNKYVFKVPNTVNKVEIRKAVEKSYKVKVLRVNVVKTLGKDRNFGRTKGRTSDFKKAIVTLKEGEKIDIAE